MKEYNRYLIGSLLIISAIIFISYYYMGTNTENFTYAEEQIITAQLLAANGGNIPQIAAGNMDDESQYKYMNSNGINVNAMPLQVQQLTNPLCFNDVIHSKPYTTMNGRNLRPEKFEVDDSLTMKQLIKANDQLIDANEELLRLSGNGEYLKQKKEHEERHTHNNDPVPADWEKQYGSNTGGSPQISGNTAASGAGNNGASLNVSVDQTGTITIKGNSNNTPQVNTPTYSSMYEEQVIGAPYKECVKRGFSTDFCNNMYGSQYGKNNVSGTSNTSSTTNLPSYESIRQNGLAASGLSSYGARKIFDRTSQPTSSSFFNKQNGFDVNEYDTPMGGSFVDINTGKTVTTCSTDKDCKSGLTCNSNYGWAIKTCS